MRARSCRAPRRGPCNNRRRDTWPSPARRRTVRSGWRAIPAASRAAVCRRSVPDGPPPAGVGEHHAQRRARRLGGSSRGTHASGLAHSAITAFRSYAGGYEAFWRTTGPGSSRSDREPGRRQAGDWRVNERKVGLRVLAGRARDKVTSRPTLGIVTDAESFSSLRVESEFGFGSHRTSCPSYTPPAARATSCTSRTESSVAWSANSRRRCRAGGAPAGPRQRCGCPSSPRRSSTASTPARSP
jgi:hypothetical protein